MSTIYNMQVRYQWLGVANMMTFNYQGPDNYAHATVFMEAWAENFTTLLPTSMIPTGLQFYELYLNDRLNEGPGIVHTPDAFPYSGGNSADTLGLSSVANYTFSAPPPNYPVRGLVQWPYVFEGWQSQGVLQHGQFATITALLEDHINKSYPTPSDPYIPVIYSAKYDNSKPISSVGLALRWTTNRRKLS